MYELKTRHTYWTICFNTEFGPLVVEDMSTSNWVPVVPCCSITQISFEQRTNRHIKERA